VGGKYGWQRSRWPVHRSLLAPTRRTCRCEARAAPIRRRAPNIPGDAATCAIYHGYCHRRVVKERKQEPVRGAPARCRWESRVLFLRDTLLGTTQAAFSGGAYTVYTSSLMRSFISFFSHHLVACSVANHDMRFYRLPRPSYGVTRHIFLLAKSSSCGYNSILVNKIVF
jgi:hypothetical protein